VLGELDLLRPYSARDRSATLKSMGHIVPAALCSQRIGVVLVAGGARRLGRSSRNVADPEDVRLDEHLGCHRLSGRRCARRR